MTTQEHRSGFGRAELAAQAPDIADFPREYLRELLDALPVAIYATDGAGRVTYFNSAAVELAGRTPELGSDLWCVSWRLYGPDGTAMTHAECPMAVSLREGRPVRGVELGVIRHLQLVSRNQRATGIECVGSRSTDEPYRASSRVQVLGLGPFGKLEGVESRFKLAEVEAPDAFRELWLTDESTIVAALETERPDLAVEYCHLDHRAREVDAERVRFGFGQVMQVQPVQP